VRYAFHLRYIALKLNALILDFLAVLYCLKLSSDHQGCDPDSRATPFRMGSQSLRAAVGFSTGCLFIFHHERFSRSEAGTWFHSHPFGPSPLCVESRERAAAQSRLASKYGTSISGSDVKRSRGRYDGGVNAMLPWSYTFGLARSGNPARSGALSSLSLPINCISGRVSTLESDNQQLNGISL
jgi:hypothetical protein